MKISLWFSLSIALFAAWPLAAAGDQTANKSSPPRVVYLNKSRFWDFMAGNHGHQTLVREFFRQAFLIAARDQLQLTTRDQWLGDSLPGQGSNAPFELRATFTEKSPLLVLRGCAPALPPLKCYKVDFNGDLPHMAAEAEEFSRTKFVDLLKEAGFAGKANAWKPEASLPEEVEHLLGEMTFAAQFHALRELHAAARAGGESPALLGGLVRGYANLGLLTEYHWHPAHRVFKARALLYAQRMVTRGDDPAWAKWHRAYALALIGLHKSALEDLDAAEKDAKTAAAKDRVPPAWVPLIRAYCHYDFSQLVPDKSPAPQAQLAAVLAYCAAELADSTRMSLAKAEEGLAVAPECYRLYDALCASGDLGEKNHGATASPTMLDAKLSARLTAMPGLPESVTAVLRQRGSGKGLFDRLLGSNESADNDEYRARGRLMAALQAADQPVDGGEPSWPALGHLIGEVSFLQAWRQVAFLRSVNASAGDSVTQLMPLVAKHCCRSLIESRRDDPTARKQALQQLAKIHHHEEGLDLRAVPVLQEIEDFDPACWNRQSPWLTLVMDDVANDLVITSKGVPDWHVSAARRLLEVSPDSPYAKAVLVESDWPSVRKQAAAWEKDAGNQPALLVALGKHHDTDGDYAAAVRCLEEAMRFAPEEETCYVLSRIYRQHGEKEKWLATLENFLKTPDRGLAHARVREEIALRLMEDKQWAKALPYAEAAAQTGAAWAMMTAAYCHEGMRNWDAAEKYLQQVASAYRGSEAWWYFFCRRTGHGDVEAARRVAHDAIENYDPRVSDRCANYNYHITAGPYFLLEKEYDKALRFYEEDFGQKNNPYVGLQIALLADRLKDFKKRDAALQRIKERSAAYMREATGKPRKELIALADLIQLDLAHGGKGEIDLEAAAKIRAGTDGKEQTNFNYFLGAYLDLHGKTKWAMHYWERCMAYSGAMGDLTRTLAGAELVAHRLPPDDDATGSRKIEESPQTK